MGGACSAGLGQVLGMAALSPADAVSGMPGSKPHLPMGCALQLRRQSPILPMTAMAACGWDSTYSTS